MIFGCIEIALTNSTKRLLSQEISPQSKPFTICKLYSKLSRYLKHETFCIVGRSKMLLFDLISKLLDACAVLRLLRTPEFAPNFIVPRQVAYENETDK